MSLFTHIGRALLSLPGRAWSLARRVVHAERAVEGVAGLDEPPDAAPFDQPLAVDNPFYQEHELFDVRVTAVQSGLRKVTAVRRRATDVNSFEDDPTDTTPITVGVVAGQMPHVGDLLRAWYDGRSAAGDPIYHALGNGDGFGKVDGVGDDGAGHVQVVVRRSALAFAGGVWTESDPAEFITAYALPQRQAVFRVGDHVTLYRVGSTWAAAATETGSRFSDADTVVEPAHELKFGADLELSQEAPGVARADLKTALDANARVAVRIDGGADVGKRRRFNFDNASSNVAAEIQDDPAAEEFDIRLIHDGRLKAAPGAAYGFLVDAIDHLAPLSAAVVGDVLRVSIDPASDTAPGVVQGGGPGFHVDGAGVGSVNFGLGAAQALEGSTAAASPGAANKVPLTGGSGKIDAEFVPDAGLTAAGKVSTADQTFAGKKTFTPTATKAGINVGTVDADPSTPADGDLWHVSGGSFHARLDGVTAKLAAVPTGAFAAGDVLYAAAAADKTLSRLAVGAAGKVLGVSGGLPAWVDPPASGEANTASNVGSAGTGVFDAKVGVDLQFRKLNPASAKISIALDAANKKIDFDVPDASTTAKGAVELATDGESAAGLAVQANDARLSDARTPTAHASSHQSGGADAIKLDDLAAPDDNTDLNASTTAHGLMPKLGNDAAKFFNGQGAQAAVKDSDLSTSDVTTNDVSAAKHGFAPKAPGDAAKFLDGTAAWSVPDHGSVGGLADDDHAQYALLAGRSGGQSLKGGTASGDKLTLQSTSHATRGGIELADDDFLQFDEIAAPATPAAGKVRLYAKSDGHLYQKDDAGTETDLAAGGGSGGDRLATYVNSPVAVSGATTATINKHHECTGSSAYTITLPAASGNGGKFVSFRGAQNSGVVITIDGNGSEKIDGDYERLPLLRNCWLELECDGTQWHVASFGPGADLAVAVVVASGAATVDFTGYLKHASVYTVEGIDVVPATDAVHLWCRTGSGGTYASGSGNYSWTHLGRDDNGTAQSSNSASDTEIQMTAALSMSNVSGEGGHFMLWLFNPAGTVQQKQVWFMMTYIGSTPRVVTISGAGRRTSTAAITDIRFLMSSGNISGKFILRERRAV